MISDQQTILDYLEKQYPDHVLSYSNSMLTIDGKVLQLTMTDEELESVMILSLEKNKDKIKEYYQKILDDRIREILK